MEYRKIGTDKISSLSVGLGCLSDISRTELVQIIRTAIRHGVTCFDLTPEKASSFEAFGEAVAGLRKKVFLMIHFDLDYTTDLRRPCPGPSAAFASAAGQMQLMRIDYIDAAVVSCAGEREILQQVRELKNGGVIHHVALSSEDGSCAETGFDASFMDLKITGKEDVSGKTILDGAGSVLSSVQFPRDLKDLYRILKTYGAEAEVKE